MKLIGYRYVEEENREVYVFGFENDLEKVTVSRWSDGLFTVDNVKSFVRFENVAKAIEHVKNGKVKILY